MQQTLTLWQTYSKFKRQKGKLKINFMFVIFSVFFVGVFFVACFAKGNEQVLWSEKHKFYFVMVGENLSTSSANACRKRIESAGGAGTIVGESSGNYACVIFVYDDENSAEKIRKSSQKIFDYCYIKCVSTQSLSKKIQNSIKNEPQILRCFEYLFEINDVLKTNLFDYEKGNISFSALCKQTLKSKNKIDDLEKGVTGETDLEKEVLTSLSVLSGLAGSFLEQSIKGESDVMMYRKLCVQVALEIIEINKKAMHV